MAPSEEEGVVADKLFSISKRKQLWYHDRSNIEDGTSKEILCVLDDEFTHLYIDLSIINSSTILFSN